MPIVQSRGQLRLVGAPTNYHSFDTPPGGAAPTASYGWHSKEIYARIYAAQPMVRTCVEMLAKGIAQVGLHWYRRLSDTDRERLTDYPIAQWIEHPNPSTTRYALIEGLVSDLAIFYAAYLLKIRMGPDRIGLLRLPPQNVEVVGGLLPSAYVYTPATGGGPLSYAPADVVAFRGYNPIDPLRGLSPLETLRRTLASEAAASDNRERYWTNGSRMEAVIERPRDAPRWTPQQKQAWREQWQQRFAGPASVGQVAVLEDGMQWKPVSFSAKDSEYVSSRKLTLEEIVRAYHLPLPMVGILDHATFSNIREQHKQLYSDTFGPWFTMLQEGLELQLLPEVNDARRDQVYSEFNIAEKLKGSFEEQANSLRLMVGRPVMTANEGRARLNLPRMDDPTADELAAQQGGPGTAGFGRDSSGTPIAPDQQGAAVAIVRTHLDRQAVRLRKVPAGDRVAALDYERCTRELAVDLRPLVGSTVAALQIAERITDHTCALLAEGREAFGGDREDLDVA